MGSYNETYTWLQCCATLLPGRKIRSIRQILRWSWLWYRDCQVADNSGKWLWLFLAACLKRERGWLCSQMEEQEGIQHCDRWGSPIDAEAGLAAASGARVVTAWGKGISPVPQQYQLCELSLGTQSSTEKGQQSPYSKKGRILSKSQAMVQKCCCRYFLLH